MNVVCKIKLIYYDITKENQSSKRLNIKISVKYELDYGLNYLIIFT